MEGGEYSSHRVRWDQDVRDYAQLTLFFCNPLTDCLPFLSGTDIRETECHQSKKSFVNSAQHKSNCLYLWNLPSPKSFFHWAIFTRDAQAIIVGTGMIKRTDLENCRDKSDVIYGNWWLYDQSPNLTASCPVLKPMKKFPYFYLIEKIVGGERARRAVRWKICAIISFQFCGTTGQMPTYHQ